jgi:hypothetical protein
MLILYFPLSEIDNSFTVTKKKTHETIDDLREEMRKREEEEESSTSREVELEDYRLIIQLCYMEYLLDRRGNSVKLSSEDKNYFYGQKVFSLLS